MQFGNKKYYYVLCSTVNIERKSRKAEKTTKITQYMYPYYVVLSKKLRVPLFGKHLVSHNESNVSRGSNTEALSLAYISPHRRAWT
jgi:hypothetical protein